VRIIINEISVTKNRERFNKIVERSLFFYSIRVRCPVGAARLFAHDARQLVEQSFAGNRVVEVPLRLEGVYLA
jgi:hypothetical protein